MNSADKCLSLATFLAVAGLVAALPALAQDSGEALKGKVASSVEGPMEGVVVSAKREGGSVSVAVVTDATGEYGFPKDRLPSGRYDLSIRAIGYDLGAPAVVDVTDAGAAQKDLNLTKTVDLSKQLTDAEWLASMPGTAHDKSALMHCGECHTLQRPLFSKYDAADMAKVVQRMGLHTTNAAPTHPFFLQNAADEYTRPPSKAEAALGKFISTVNLSNPANHSFPLKTFPRPSGAATKVIITTYDLPRKDAAPHDVMMDRNGVLWYSDFQSPLLGRLDPATGKVVEYPIPIQKSVQNGFPTGGLQIAVDRSGYVWEGTMGQAQIVRFDPKTDKMQIWLAPDWKIGDTRVTMVDPYSDEVDGKVWFSEAGLPDGGVTFQLDTKTGEAKRVDHPKTDWSQYGIASDSENNVYGMGLTNNNIWRTDAKTLATTFFKIPILGAGGRRGHVDSKNRLWWGQYYGNSLAMFDPATNKITEWKVPTPFMDPYDAQFDDMKYLWTGGMDSDRVERLNVDTGHFTEYLLPRETNIRRIDVQKSGKLSSVWFGDQHNGKIIHVEPLSD